MQQVINLGALGKKPDHKMSKEEMLEHCMERLDWLTTTLFGNRDDQGKLLKNEMKDEDGKVLQLSYQVGLLQKFEGVWDYNEETKQPELKQQGMEQLWQELREMIQAMIFEQTVQRAILGVMLKIDPEVMADFFEKNEAEVNNWTTNYQSRMRYNLKKIQDQQELKSKKLKKDGILS